VRRCRGAGGTEVQRCRGEEVQRWCRGGAEVLERRSRGGGVEVVQRCRAGALVQRCRGRCSDEE